MNKINKKNNELDGLNKLYTKVSDILDFAKNKILLEANQRILEANFKIGKLIVEVEQEGQLKANYGAKLIQDLSSKLSLKYGRGYSVDNLERMRNFYKIYSNLEYDLRKLTLTWSHYLFLIKIKDSSVRTFYEYESQAENWKLDELKRQFNSGLFERLALSLKSKDVKQLAEIGNTIISPSDIVKNNYILEFISEELKAEYSESDLENAIITNLEKFILELGKGFSFVGRQFRIGGGENQLRIDLVFYNRLLKSHFLIDLKIGELTYSDIGQMQIYKKYFDDEIKKDWENKTVGLILSYLRDDFIVKYMPEDEYLFASEYQLYLPTKDDLKKLQSKILNNLNKDKE
jgi:predicted nuclease of restriction endonuclease-like (RecB) superfamily